VKKILVPLDGSELSERALPYATELARAQGASLTLVRVVEFQSWSFDGGYGYMDAVTYDELIGAIRGDATDSLARNRDQLSAAGVTAETKLVEGVTASASILDCEAELSPDLVIAATHGRSGIARFALGSVADRLVREGSAPVLLIPAFGDGGAHLARAVVPLDGSSLAERVLPIVEDLAGRPLTEVMLLTAVSSQPINATPNAAFASAVAATEYLNGVAKRLDQHGLHATVKVVVSDPAEAIEHAAAGADLVIMSTHGRGGLDRMRHGSVAERATRGLSIPRLLVRA
jgi:nucleotide-binding universal stress UspA family protein